MNFGNFLKNCKSNFWKICGGYLEGIMVVGQLFVSLYKQLQSFDLFLVLFVGSDWYVSIANTSK